MQNEPFHLTRRRLAAWYTGVMSVILMLCGLGIYRLIVHAHWLYLMQEMQALAYRFENRIEPALKHPGQLEPQAFKLLPGLCLPNQPCPLEANSQVDRLTDPEIQELYKVTRDNYCIRFLNASQQTIATFQVPSTNPVCQSSTLWQEGRDGEDHFFHLASYPLHTRTQAHWGTIQMARSLDDQDLELFQIELMLVAVILIAIAAAGGCSWWLAGLAMQPIRQSYEQMEQFTADAAHELRTPLAALRAMVQTALRSEHLSLHDAKETLYSVNRQSSRLSKLVQDLLTLCHLDQAQSTKPTLCCLNSMLQDLMDEFDAIALTAEVQLSVELPHETLQVKGNEEQLYRAIANLVNNAIQYTPAGGRVTLVLTQQFPHAVIQVKDTGIGIAPAEQTKIFNRFYRVDQERSRQRGGSGLGLAIVQAIVQAHQGVLQVQSASDKGSTFTIRLPLMPVQPER